MALKLIIAQELDVDFKSFNEWIESYIKTEGDNYVIFREFATPTHSTGRWVMVLRHKNDLDPILIKDGHQYQGLFSFEDISKEKFQNDVRNKKIRFDQLGIMENDIKIGYAELTPISSEKTQFILYLNDTIDESFAEPIYKAIKENFKVPTRVMTDKIDPKIGKQFIKPVKNTRQKSTKKKISSSKLDAKKDRSSEGKLPEAKGPTTPNPQIQPLATYKIEGEKPCHQPIIDSWNRGFSAKEISVQLSINNNIKMNHLSVHNELSFLRKQLGEDIVPQNKNRPKKMPK